MHSIDKDGGPTWRATSNSGGTQPCRIVGRTQISQFVTLYSQMKIRILEHLRDASFRRTPPPPPPPPLDTRKYIVPNVISSELHSNTNFAKHSSKIRPFYSSSQHLYHGLLGLYSDGLEPRASSCNVGDG